MATATYHFDGNGGVSDPSGVWMNDANAFDGSTATRACTQSAGQPYLQGIGTTAPSSGGAITQVRARMNFGGTSSTAVGSEALIYDSTITELLGTATDIQDTSTTWGSYVVLDAPTGGWSWTEVQGLVVRFRGNSASDPEPFAYCAAIAEVEVTYDDAPPSGITSVRVGGTFQSATTMVKVSGTFQEATTLVKVGGVFQ